MSRICSLCGKGSMIVTKLNKLRGKFNPAPKTRKHPNLQMTTLPSGEKVKACVKCIKTLSKDKKK